MLSLARVLKYAVQKPTIAGGFPHNAGGSNTDEANAILWFAVRFAAPHDGFEIFVCELRL
jgi:hypothetical protein